MSMHASLCTRALITLSKDDHESAKSKNTLTLLMAEKLPIYIHAALSAIWDSMS